MITDRGKGMGTETEIRNVIFDIGEVIVTWRPREYMRARFGEERGGALFDAVFGHPYWREHIDYGYKDEKELFEAMRGFSPALAEDISELERDWYGVYAPKTDTVRLIERLKAAGYGLYYLSNYPEHSFRYVLENNPVFRLMDGGVVSWQVHAVKPDPAIYRALLDRYGLAAGTCVFTDDSPLNTAGARACGLHTVDFTGAAQLEQALSELGLRF